MEMAFVLINSETGSEDEVLKALEEIPEVREAHQLYGVYGIIIKVEAETMQELKEIVTQRIRPLDKVHATLTMICHDPGGAVDEDGLRNRPV